MVISLERDQQAGDDSDVSGLRVLKNRPVGLTGPAGLVKYNHETGRLESLESPEDASPFEAVGGDAEEKGDF